MDWGNWERLYFVSTRIYGNKFMYQDIDKNYGNGLTRLLDTGLEKDQKIWKWIKILENSLILGKWLKKSGNGLKIKECI